MSISLTDLVDSVAGERIAELQAHAGKRIAELEAEVERLNGMIGNILDDVHCGERREDILETYEQAEGGKS